MKRHVQVYFNTIFLFASIKLTFCQDSSVVAQTVRELNNLLKINIHPKGEIFPDVIGPDRRDHVCIVGAGASGIHMALSLKDKGYKDVTIFEKTDRVGGKIKDLQIDGYYQWHGAIFLTADYLENIIELAKRYNVGDVHAIPTPGVGNGYLS